MDSPAATVDEPRDPRINPMPRDRVFVPSDGSSKGAVRTVCGIDGERVFWMSDYCQSVCTLATWRKRAKRGRVFFIASED